MSSHPLQELSGEEAEIDTCSDCEGEDREEGLNAWEDSVTRLLQKKEGGRAR